MLVGKCGKRLAADASAAATRRFGVFEVETECKVRTHQVKSNPVLEEMRSAWLECRYYRTVDGDGGAKVFAMMLGKILGIAYSTKDVETFSLALEGIPFESEFSPNAGLYLSALINNCIEERFVIHTSHFTKPINSIGYHNTKKITVEGDAGDFIGWSMKSGSISVKGNAGSSVGFEMEGGEIAVDGDCGFSVGWGMKGGDITVGRNASTSVGVGMKGGSITVRGNASVLVGKDMNGGMIIVEGNTGRMVGESMLEGTIIVNGNAKGDVGMGMRSGKITVNGNAGDYLGAGMEGGEIHINGDKFAISTCITGGKIFHKGILMVDK